jgi:hypothetical protein
MSAKRAKNLLLDVDALNRAESYCQEHGMTLSRLVEDFLLALPNAWSSEEARSPIVRRLRSAVVAVPLDPDAYGDYLYRRSRGKTRDELSRFGDDR